MKSLLNSLPGKTVLLWVANTPPPTPGRRADLGLDPLLVDAEMIGAVRGHASTYIEVVASAEALSRGTSGMAFAPLDAPAAQTLPGPAVHRQIADQLGPELLRLI